MANKRTHQPKVIVNRRARYDYTLGDSLIVGLSLSGKEVKALRLGHGQLRGAYITIKDNELWLINATISSANGFVITDSEQTRARKVLAKRREINALMEAKRQGRTIIPLEMLTGGRYIKLRIAVGQGKKQYDKRQAIKAREASRRIQSTLKRR